MFKGYSKVKNPVFKAYMQTKEDSYDDGADINSDTLMKLANNKYKVLVDKTSGIRPLKKVTKLSPLKLKYNS